MGLLPKAEHIEENTIMTIHVNHWYIPLFGMNDRLAGCECTEELVLPGFSPPPQGQDDKAALAGNDCAKIIAI